MGSAQLIRKWSEAGATGLFRTHGWLGIGFVWLRSGQVLDCQLGSLRGRAAFNCVMSQRSGTYEFQHGDVKRDAAFKETTQQLLDEHAKYASDWDELVAKLPALASVLILDNDAVDQHRTHLTSIERGVLSLASRRRRIHELVEESNLEPRVTLAAVAQLLELGLVAVSNSEPPTSRSSSPAVRAHAMPMKAVTGAPPMSPLKPVGGTVPGFPRVEVSDGQRPAHQASAPEQPITNEVSDWRVRLDSAPPSASSDASPSERVVQRIGRYDVIRRLGRGGMGTVYLVQLRGEGGFERQFALKVLRTHLAADPKAVRALYDEARITSRLNHANVVSVVDVGSHSGQPYVVMDYVNGLSLAELLSSGHEEAFPGRVVAVLLDALAGLSAVHTAEDDNGAPLSLIHHDVSPHNYLVGIDGVCRLTDFGIAGLNSLQAKRAERGKPAYMSPERVRGTAVDARSDIFSLGVIMWTALTGRRLFDTGEVQHTMSNVLNLPIPPPSSVSDAPECLDAICLKALARDPERRYSSAEEMSVDLRSVAAANGLLGSPADVSVWVRAAIGVAGQRSSSAPAPLHEDGVGEKAGNTIPIPSHRRVSLPLRLAQYSAVLVALAVLLAAILAPEDALESWFSDEAQATPPATLQPEVEVTSSSPLDVDVPQPSSQGSHGAAPSQDSELETPPEDGPKVDLADPADLQETDDQPASRPTRRAVPRRPQTARPRVAPEPSDEAKQPSQEEDEANAVEAAPEEPDGPEVLPVETEKPASGDEEEPSGGQDPAPLPTERLPVELGPPPDPEAPIPDSPPS